MAFYYQGTAIANPGSMPLLKSDRSFLTLQQYAKKDFVL